jgi:cobalt-zinc-cadmium efflux system protein
MMGPTLAFFLDKHHMGLHHHHDHDDTSEKRLWTVFLLNGLFTLIEFVGGYLTQSTAIMADAIHDLGDTLSIGSALLLNRLGARASNAKFTYGYRRLSLFGALINAIILTVGCVWILSEALERLAQPIMPNAMGMLYLALLGVIVNAAAAFRLRAGKTLNEKVLNWHLLEDMFGWIVVLIASIVLMFHELAWLDPALSVGFSLFILFNVAKLLWQTLKLFAQSVPDLELADKLRDSLLSVPAVKGIHHFHLWSLDGERHVASAHLEVASGVHDDYDELKHTISAAVAPLELFHTTFEIEYPGETCRNNTH